MSNEEMATFNHRQLLCDWLIARQIKLAICGFFALQWVNLFSTEIAFVKESVVRYHVMREGTKTSIAESFC